jgi:hypothetical protein
MLLEDLETVQLRVKTPLGDSDQASRLLVTVPNAKRRAQDINADANIGIRDIIVHLWQNQIDEGILALGGQNMGITPGYNPKKGDELRLRPDTPIASKWVMQRVLVHSYRQRFRCECRRLSEVGDPGDP